jgi:hypothetical protein
MHSTELFLRQEADTAREAIREDRRARDRNTEDRRKESMKEARREINIYLSQGMDRNIAINFVLDSDNKIPILYKREVRKEFRYGCHTICSIIEELSGIKCQNSLDLVVEAV